MEPPPTSLTSTPCTPRKELAARTSCKNKKEKKKEKEREREREREKALKKKGCEEPLDRQRGLNCDLGTKSGSGYGCLGVRDRLTSNGSVFGGAISFTCLAQNTACSPASSRVQRIGGQRKASECTDSHMKKVHQVTSKYDTQRRAAGRGRR
ncbi:hypothetical protein CRUP_025646 [Coryphaenoides rupestris]|nr:hypothetical protein CRUP_025646 [Coryphaenoides rupestris]